MDVQLLLRCVYWYLDDFVIWDDCHGIGSSAPSEASTGSGYGTVLFIEEGRSAVGFDYEVTGFSYVDISSVQFLLTGSGFLGVIDDSRFISWIGFYNPGSYQDPVTDSVTYTSMTIDNVVMSRVPESSTLLLFASAFALLQGVRRRRKSASRS